MRLRIGFLASHGGSALAAIVGAIGRGDLSAEAAVVISNNSGAAALDHARSAGIPTLHLSATTHPGPQALDVTICRTLDEHGADLVILSGYMKKVGPQTLRRFRGRILNTHPALLPSFGGHGMYGIHIHEAVLAAGVAVTGVTIHVVDEHYDHGLVLSRREVAVLSGDSPESLQKRVKDAEGDLLVSTLMDISAGRLRLPP